MKFKVANQDDEEKDRDVMARIVPVGSKLRFDLSYDGCSWTEIFDISQDNGITRSSIDKNNFGLPMNKAGWIKTFTEDDR